MPVTKRALGIDYVTGTGIVLSALFIPAFGRQGVTPSVMLLGLLGLIAALGLAGIGVWLRACRLHDDQIWRVATHVGLGIGLLTLSNLLVVFFGTVVAVGSTESTILASSIAIGGAGGAVVGVAREFDRSTRTLTQSTEVLSRALRHNLRNDMTVILGQLDDLEAQVSGTAAENVRSIRHKIDEVVTLSDQAQQIEIAVTGESRQRHPIDAVDFIDRRVRAVQSMHPDVTIDADLPETAWVSADWMLGAAIENVLETAISNGGEETTLELTVDHPKPGWTAIRITDVNGNLPAAEIAPLDSGTETPLQHGEGLELWLVNWIVARFGGDLAFEHSTEECIVTMRLHRAMPARRRPT